MKMFATGLIQVGYVRIRPVAVLFYAQIVFGAGAAFETRCDDAEVTAFAL